MNRLEFQGLADERLSDAEALLRSGRYACAYYVSGYTIECALKACISRRTQRDDFPPKEAAKYYVHDLSRLLEFAGLEDAFAQNGSLDPAFRANWGVVKDWSEEARYQSAGEREAREILAAITDPDHGVLQWLRKNW